MKCIGKTTFLSLYLSFILPYVYAQEYAISGSGYSEPLGNHPMTIVEIYQKSTMVLLGSDTTDTNGDYDIAFTLFGISKLPEQSFEVAKLIKNPSNDVINIELSTTASQNWLIRVYDESGKVECSQTLYLDKGTHKIKINGLGNAGLKTIILSGTERQFALKAVLIESAPLSPRIISSSIPHQLKSVNDADSLFITFSPTSNYIGMDTVLPIMSQTVDYVLKQIPDTITITGSGYAEPHNNHPMTIVEIYQKSAMTLLGSDTTDVNGDYGITFSFFGNSKLTEQPFEVAKPNQLKSNNEEDSLYIAYSPVAHYIGMDTVLPVMSQMANYVLRQAPDTVKFTLVPYLETGEPVNLINPDFTITIEWEDSTIVYPVIGGKIQITKLLYPEIPAVLGSIYINNDTSTRIVNGIPNRVLNWCIGRHPKQVTNRPNIYQSDCDSVLSNVEYRTLIPLDSLINKTVFHYMVRKWSEINTGVFKPLDDEFTRDVLLNNGFHIGTSMYIDLSRFGVTDSLDIVLFGWNTDGGEPVPDTLLEKARNSIMKVLQTKYLPNGDTLFPPHRVFQIDSESDPRWQAVLNRGLQNSISSGFYGVTFPSGVIGPNSQYTYNGAKKLGYGGAQYNIIHTDAEIFTANFFAFTGESSGLDDISYYLWNTILDEPSQYTYSISNIPVLLNLGTGIFVTSSFNK